MSVSIGDVKKTIKDHFGSEAVDVASLGGSATWAMRWPEDLEGVGAGDGVKEIIDAVETPFGDSAYIKLVSIRGKPVIRFAFHGWHDLLNEADERQTMEVFYILHELGVKKILIDASVGGITLAPWDVAIGSDLLIENLDTVSSLAIEFGRQVDSPPWKRMAEPYCRELSSIVYKAVYPAFGESELMKKGGGLYKTGVYVNTSFGQFETASHIRAVQNQGADFVGQTSALELVLARICGICAAGLYIPANFAEGLSGGEWSGDMSMKDYYIAISGVMGELAWAALEAIVDSEITCGSCAELKAEELPFPVPGA